MVNSLNCIEDDFLTPDHIGGGKSYISSTPILLKGAQYRCCIYAYGGVHFSFFHVDGRNSDSEEWKILVFSESDSLRDVLFTSDKDYCQVRIFWNKSATEQYARIAYWLRPDNSI